MTDKKMVALTQSQIQWLVATLANVGMGNMAIASGMIREEDAERLYAEIGYNQIMANVAAFRDPQHLMDLLDQTMPIMAQDLPPALAEQVEALRGLLRDMVDRATTEGESNPSPVALGQPPVKFESLKNIDTPVGPARVLNDEFLIGEDCSVCDAEDCPVRREPYDPSKPKHPFLRLGDDDVPSFEN